VFKTVKKALDHAAKSVSRTARMFARWVQPPKPRPVTRARLGQDPFLEAREVPATFYWVGDVDHYYHKAANWTQSTDPNNKPDAMTPPPPGSDIHFDGRYSSANCFWGTGPGQHNSVRLVNDYLGTVQTGPLVTVGTYEQTCVTYDPATDNTLTSPPY
jgi:hypothetical protein